MKYVAIIVKAGNGYSAYLPDLPGCISAAETFAETEELIRQGALYHVELMAEHGETIPFPPALPLRLRSRHPERQRKYLSRPALDQHLLPRTMS